MPSRSPVGAGTRSRMVSSSGSSVLLVVFERVLGDAELADGVERRKVGLRVARLELAEEVEHLGEHVVRPRVVAVDLVDDDDDRQAELEAFCSTKRVCGSGPSAASTSRSAPSAIFSVRSTSPPKSAWPGVSTMLMVTSL